MDKLFKGDWTIILRAVGVIVVVAIMGVFTLRGILCTVDHDAIVTPRDVDNAYHIAADSVTSEFTQQYVDMQLRSAEMCAKLTAYTDSLAACATKLQTYENCDCNH